MFIFVSLLICFVNESFRIILTVFNLKIMTRIFGQFFAVLFLLFVLFLSACSKSDDGIALYEINGTVVADATNSPLVKIRMIRQSTDYLLFSDTVYTDSLGKYSFGLTDYYNKNASFSIRAIDIDAAKNGGEFVAKDVKVTFSAADWTSLTVENDYKGYAVKTQNIRLVAKQ